MTLLLSVHHIQKHLLLNQQLLLAEQELHLLLPILFSDHLCQAVQRQSPGDRITEEHAERCIQELRAKAGHVIPVPVCFRVDGNYGKRARLWPSLVR
jgi:hypothetical protein